MRSPKQDRLRWMQPALYCQVSSDTYAQLLMHGEVVEIV